MGSRFPTTAFGPRPAMHLHGGPRPYAPPVALFRTRSGDWGSEESLESRCREAGLQPAAPPRVGPPSLVVSCHWKTASECSLGAPDSAQGYYCTCFGNAGLGGTDVRTVLPYWVTDESVNKFLIRAPGPHSRDVDTAFLPEAWSFFLRSRA